MRRRFLVITNPGAGVSGSSLVDDSVRALERAGAEVTCSRPASVEDARRIARQAAAGGTVDAVVVAGGDGTIRHVSAALLDSPIPFGIIPVGTGNVLAHEIGVALEPEAIARMLLSGPTKRIACAQANGEPFLLMVGVGFDARVVAGLDQRFKSRLGKVAYAAPLLGALVRPMDRLIITVDGRRCEASWAVIANARCYGGGFVLAPHTGVGQRGLQAVLFKAGNRAVLLSQLMSLVLGTLDARAAQAGDIEMIACSHVSIAAANAVPVQIDGDVFGTTPVEIDCGSAELHLIVPPEAH